MQSGKVIIANWKMHGSVEFIHKYISELYGKLVENNNNLKTIICPPNVYIPVFKELLNGSDRICLGAQNCYLDQPGAFTGEISPSMLQDFCCKYVILGHSERRTIFKEVDSLISDKAKAVIKAGLIPILCIGESLADRNENKTFDVLCNQLDFFDLDQHSNAIIAYEPIWAIGTGESASVTQVEQVLKFIKDYFIKKDLYFKTIYGGSVKPTNSKELLSSPSVDGFLVGGASLNVEEFSKICDF